jgi:L-ascorbate metabolism protein UlaG (beta-lactamase superfamily)
MNNKTVFVLSCILIGSLISTAGTAAEVTSAGSPTLKEFLDSPVNAGEVAFRFMGSSTVVIRTEDQLILVDPASCFDRKDFPMLKTKGISCIVYTHGHGDHFNAASAVQLFGLSQPPVVCTAEIARQLAQKIPAAKLVTAKPGKPFTAGKITFDAVQGVHPGGALMYRMTIGNLAIFHGADSGYVPLKDCPSRVAFLPIGGASPTASPDDAVRMATDLKPKIVVAMPGNDSQPAVFKGKMAKDNPSTKVAIPKPNECGTVKFN